MNYIATFTVFQNLANKIMGSKYGHTFLNVRTLDVMLIISTELKNTEVKGLIFEFSHENIWYIW